MSTFFFFFNQKIYFSFRKNVSIARKPSEIRLSNPCQSPCVIMFSVCASFYQFHISFSFTEIEGESMTWKKVFHSDYNEKEIKIFKIHRVGEI
jgi:hypothetical protein